MNCADERAICGGAEDARRLVHLDEERRAVPVKLVPRADAAENSVHEAHLDAVGGHEASSLGEDDDEGVLAEEGALARHVLRRGVSATVPVGSQRFKTYGPCKAVHEGIWVGEVN